MGNRAKPTALRILEGNRGHRPINYDEPKAKRGIPSMPKWLKPFKIAVQEWKRESKILDNMGIMTEAETGVLAQRSYIAHKIQVLAVDIENEGDTIESKVFNKHGNESASTKINPKVTELKSLLSEYRQYGSLLGLDPSSRAKLKADNPKQKSKAELFKARKKA